MKNGKLDTSVSDKVLKVLSPNYKLTSKPKKRAKILKD
jgi:hypothetical protein